MTLPDPQRLPDPATRRTTSSRRPGVDDAARATVGVVVTYGVALLIGGLAALLSDPGQPGYGSAGAARAELAVRGVVFAACALLLIEGLRLVHRPRSADALPQPSPGGRLRPPLLPVISVGLGAAVGAYLVGPLVSRVLPSLSDGARVVDDLGIGSSLGADLGTVFVIAGIVPLGEELLFRGVLVGAWVRARQPVIAVVSSTVLFSLAHATVGERSIVVTALLGALFAAAFLISGSLGAPVLAHCVINAIALMEGGMSKPVPLVVLALTVVATTLAASRLSPLVSWRPPAGTLRE